MVTNLTATLIILAMTIVIIYLYTKQVNQALAQTRHHQGQLAEKNRELEQRAEEMTTLYETSLQIGAQTGNLTTLLNTIVRRATQLLGVDGGMFSLLNPKTGLLDLAASYNLPPGSLVYSALPPGEGLVGRVAQTGEPLAVQNYDRWEGRVQTGTGAIFKRILGVPIKQETQIIGVLTIFDQNDGPFAEDQVQLLSLFAAQAAIAVENTRLLEAEQRHRQTAETLSDIARVAGASLDLTEVLNQVLSGLERVLLYDSIAIFLIEEDHFRTVATNEGNGGQTLIGATYPMTKLSFNHYIVRTRRPQLIPDTRQTEHFSPVTRESMAVRSIIGIPLISQDNVIGTISIGGYSPNQYSEEDVQIAFQFAQGIAVAIDNARLYQHAQQEIAERVRAEESLRQSEAVARNFQEHLKALHNLNLALSQADSFDNLCRLAVELGHTQLKYDRLSMWFFDDDRQFILGTYGISENSQLRDERDKRLPVDPKGRAIEVLSNQSSLVFQDDVPLYDSNHHIIGRGWAAMAAIWDGTKIIGFLSVDNLLQQQPASEYQLELLKLYGATLGHLILRQRTEESLQAYSERLEEMVAEQTQELRETQFQLVQQEKLALLGQLAAGIAHELRNPLGVITNSTYLLQLLLTNPDEMVSEHLALINDRVYEAEKIISALLKLSYTHAAEPAVTDLAGLTAEVLFEQPPPDNVTVSSLIDPNLPSAWIDRQQIKQVLVNLVTNAYQALPNGGALSISARVVSRGELSSGAREQGSKAESSLTTPYLHTPAPPHNYVALSLTDTGAGISPETQAKIFEPLYTTKARGIGLGLAICRNLVEINGGNIEVESVEGKGSVFTLILPALEEVPS